jgi:hypothetical protein
VWIGFSVIKLKVDGGGLLGKVARAIKSVVDPRGEQAARELMSALVANTPIDTGYARSRWVFNSDGPYQLKYGVSKDNPLFGEFSYTISNDASYIQYLNLGSSKQAPAYFIEATILAYGYKIDKALQATYTPQG